MTNLLDILVRLADCKVRFVLVGGMAAAAHGCSIVTQDIDVCLDFENIENLVRLQSAMHDLNPVHRLTPNKLPFQHDKEALQQFKNLYLRTDLGILDCLGEVTGIGTYAEVEKHSQFIDIQGRPCRLLKLDQLIAAKQALARPRDLEAVRQLAEIKRMHGLADG